MVLYKFVDPYYESIGTGFEHSIIKVAAACSGVTLYFDYRY
jgi:hypothetical protein